MDHLLKTKKEFKNQRNRRHELYLQNELDKAYFQYDMAYGDFKDLANFKR